MHLSIKDAEELRELCVRYVIRLCTDPDMMEWTTK